jgi:hypothetical protein
MTWFKYLKSSEITNSSIENINYKYPYLKRAIKNFKPLDTILSGTWAFISVQDLEINKYLNSSLENVVDESSYLVVYESTTNENDFKPVKSIIYNNILYFQIAEQHESGVNVVKQYAMYYKTPGLRYIKSINNGSKTSYQLTTESLGEYHCSYSQVDLSSFDVNLSSNSFYNFSFNSEWENGVSKNSLSFLTLTFTGPNIYIYGDKGSNFGKFKLRIFSLQGQSSEGPTLVQDWQIIDCYSSNNLSNQILFQKNNLELRDYNLELQVLDDKNILSSNNIVKINSYSFTYNLYLETDTEQITENTSFVVFGGVR